MQSYRRLVREFKKAYGDFSVRRVKMPKGFAGDCDKTKNGFKIRISKDLDEEGCMNTLTHEVSHILSWEEHVRGETHGKKWAIKYGECYKICERVCEEAHNE